LITDKIINSVEGGLRFFLDAVGNNIDSVIELDTALNDKVLLSKTGSLVTVVEVKGNVTEDDDFYSIKSRTDGLSEKFKSYIVDGAHDFHVSFRNETGGCDEIVNDSQSRARESARSVGWGMEALFDSQRDTLASRIVSEKVYFALWTHPDGKSL